MANYRIKETIAIINVHIEELLKLGYVFNFVKFDNDNYCLIYPNNSMTIYTPRQLTHARWRLCNMVHILEKYKDYAHFLDKNLFNHQSHFCNE